MVGQDDAETAADAEIIDGERCRRAIESMIVDRTTNAQVRQGLCELSAVFILAFFLAGTPWEAFDEVSAALCVSKVHDKFVCFEL